MKRLPSLLALQLLLTLAFPALAQRAYVTEVLDGTLSVVDVRRKPGIILATVPAGTLPLAAVADRHGRYLFVPSLDSGNLLVFDLRPMPPVLAATLPLGGELGGVAASPTADRVYAARFEDNRIAVIDSSLSPPAVIHTLTAGGEPDGVAFSPDGSRVYVANAEDNIATVSLLSVIDATATPPAVVTSIDVDPEPHGIAVAPNGLILITSSDRATVSLIDPQSLLILDTLQLPSTSRPYAIAIAPGGASAYVTDIDTGLIFALAIAADHLTLSQSYDFGAASFGIDVLPNGLVAAGHRTASQLKILDFSTNPASEVDAIATGDFPLSFGRFVYPEPPGFRDGFESGTTAAWSLTVP